MGISFDKMDGLIWFDGALVPWADANVHVLTHGLHYASCVFEDGSLSTPPLGTILPGITRDSIIALAKDSGTHVREEAYTIDQWRADAASGKLKEAFACGTAAVISPIGKVCSASGEFLISGGVAGPVAMGLRKKLVDIQYGRAEDPHDWIRKVL